MFCEVTDDSYCVPPCPVQAKKPPKPDDSDETHWYVALSSAISYTQRRPVTYMAVPHDVD